MRKNYVNFMQIASAGIMFVITCVILAVGAVLLSGLKSDATIAADANATLTIQRGQDALNIFSGKLGLLALIFVFSLIIGMVVTYMFVKMRTE